MFDGSPIKIECNTTWAKTNKVTWNLPCQGYLILENIYQEQQQELFPKSLSYTDKLLAIPWLLLSWAAWIKTFVFWKLLALANLSLYYDLVTSQHLRRN